MDVNGRMNSAGLPALLAILALALGLAACGGGEARKAEHVAKGEQFLAERNYEKARVEFRNALQIDPKDARVRALAGLANERLGNYQDAVRSYRVAIAADASLEMPRARLARILVGAGLGDEALEVLEPGLASSPQSAELLAARAMATGRTNPSKALEDAQKALRIDPNNSEAIMVLASLQWAAGERDVALGTLAQGIERMPEAVDLRTVHAQALIAAERPADAERQYAELVRLDPSRIDYRYLLVQVQLAQQKPDAAIATLAAAVAAFPDDVEVKLTHAQLIAQRDSFETGEKQLLDYSAKAPENLDLQLGIGRFYEVNGKQDQAHRTYQRIVEEARDRSQGVTARRRLAAMSLLAGKVDDAATYVGQVLELNPRDGEALAMRAELAIRRGDTAAAVTDLRTALSDQPDSVALATALARAHQVAGDSSLAEQVLRTLVKGNPGDLQARLVLAQYFAETGKPDQAKPVLEQLVKDQPNNAEALEALYRTQMTARDFDAALRSAQALQGLLAGSGRSFILAGAALEGLNRPADARAAYEQAAAAGELVADPILALARLDVREGKANVGLARIDKQIAVTPDVASLHAMRGDVLLSLNRPGEAAISYGRATILQPAWVQAYRGQASALVAAGQVERAIEVLGNALAPTGDALIILADLSALNAKAGRPDEAIRALEDALARAPNDMLVANNLAMLLANHRAGDPRSMERAIGLASRFADSQDPILLDTYGWVLHRAGRSAEAVPVLRKAVAQAPQVSEYQYHLGMALLVSGDRAAARKLLEAAVRAGGQFEGAAEARKALVGL